jgi:GDP/UDP-N,N'-diacetylbacillosamine 2-epimerase (hydrolysing)
MSRKICIVTGSRAEYGLLRGVIEGVESAAGLQLQLVATGSHLSPEFGLTYREIEEDGHRIDARVEVLLSSDSATAVTKAVGLGLIGFGDAFARLAPDIVVVLGDRYEILAAAAAAMICRIPLAHLHGGELSEGAIDEAIRHSVTKMSHLHFVAAEPYRRRVVQLGEHPNRVFMVGGLGVDGIRRTKLLERPALEAALGFTLRPRNLLVTFHPVTLEGDSAATQLQALLEALDRLDDTGLIFTQPNADTGGREVAQMVTRYAATRPHVSVYESLGQLRYLSCLSQVDGVVGNSSSGLAEAPSFGIPTLNIGDRQLGRLRASSVIDCAPDADSIGRGLAQVFDPGFRAVARAASNPYGDGGASRRIVEVLSRHPLYDLLKKTFHDLPQD